MIGWEDLPATFTAAQARRAGVQNRDLYRARDDGVLLELSRGVFRRASAPTPTYPGLLGVAHRAPGAVVCLLSAAAVHGLTDELPPAIQIAVPRRAWRPVIEYPPVEVFSWDAATFELGLELVDAAEGEPVRVYSPARTVVDLMRLRQRVGESVAHIAVRRYVSSPRRRIGELIELAESLDVLGPVRAAVEVLTAS
ncbi:MAG: type IV toxin-antitoxin system AbiEi family antitoxin domain-containing protein [Streptomycetales bacterium]